MDIQSELSPLPCPHNSINNHTNISDNKNTRQLDFYIEDLAKQIILNNSCRKASHLPRLKQIIKRIQYSIAYGSLAKNAVMLNQGYWSEVKPMSLNFNGETFKGRIYPYHFPNDCRNQWQTGTDTTGVPYRTQFSFEDYLNQVFIPSLHPDIRNKYKNQLTRVEYYTSPELITLQSYFDLEGKIYTKHNCLNEWTDFRMANPDSTEVYSSFYSQKKMTMGKTHAQYILKDYTYMYILDAKKRLYIQIKEKGKTNHSSLSRGQAVLAAGNLKISSGKIIEIDTFSGHYKPTETQLVTLLDFLRKQNVNINEIKLTYVGDYRVQPWKILEVNPGDVEEWLNQRQKTLI